MPPRKPTRARAVFPRQRACSDARSWTLVASRIVSKEIVAVLLLALAGFLIGGVYSTWKTMKAMAIVLAAAAAIAVGGAVVWLTS